MLNPDAKTVAWIRADRTTVSRPAAAQLPARLQVTAVRGYQPQADRVSEMLAAAAGLDGSAVRPLDAALAMSVLLLAFSLAILLAIRLASPETFRARLPGR